MVHNFWRERKAEADSNRGPFAYQPNRLTGNRLCQRRPLDLQLRVCRSSASNLSADRGSGASSSLLFCHLWAQYKPCHLYKYTQYMHRIWNGRQRGQVSEMEHLTRGHPFKTFLFYMKYQFLQTVMSVNCYICLTPLSPEKHWRGMYVTILSLPQWLILLFFFFFSFFWGGGGGG